MNRLIALVLCLALGQACAAPGKQPSARFDFQGISVGQVVQLIYSEAFATPYVIDPEVLADSRQVSFRYASDNGDLRAFLRVFLESLGYAVTSRSGVDLISKLKLDERRDASEVFVYAPRFRDVPYLSRLLAPLFSGSFSVNRSVRASSNKIDSSVPDGSAASMVDQAADTLIFSGSVGEIERLRKLLPQVDTAAGEVLVRGVVYEVSNSDKSGSAFGLLASALSGKLSIGLGTITNAGNFAQFKSASLEAVYSALSNDSRFKVLSSPSLRIRSGKRGTFSVGQDVPVLGALSFPQGSGQAVQSVEYRSSGVIFEIQPTVRDAVIELNIDQQLSNFIATTTGVNNSPTLTKRALHTSVGLQDGDVIVLGGLAESKTSHTRDGLSFLPRWLDTKGSESSQSEILLILQIQRL